MGNDESYYHHFQYYDSVRKAALGGRSHIITIELAKSNNVEKKTVDEMSTIERWVIFLKNCSNRDKRAMINQIISLEEGISMAAETLLDISKNEHERARLLTEYKIILDYQSGIVAATKKGEAKGEAKGKAIGEATGKNAMKRAIKLIKLNTPIDKIVEETGLELAEVQELWDDFQKS